MSNWTKFMVGLTIFFIAVTIREIMIDEALLAGLYGFIAGVFAMIAEDNSFNDLEAKTSKVVKE